MRHSASTFCILLMLIPAVAFSQPQPDTQHLNMLAFFAGEWSCRGKFANGKPIAAKERFKPILGGTFLLFHHDDLPPHQYHALAEWGWDAATKNFIGIFEDSSGGVRIFRSKGWNGSALQWLGGSLPDAADQQFEFERLSQKQFRVSYSYMRNARWVAVDSSICSMDK